MPKRVLDTNALINHWRQCVGDRRLREITARMATGWATQLIGLEGTSAILTPTLIEFACGASSGHELHLGRAYVRPFEVADGGTILKQDWEYALRLAERVPPDGLPRQMADCLMRAICERLHLEFVTREIRYPHPLPGRPGR